MTEFPGDGSRAQRTRIERLNVLLLVSSFLLTLHTQETTGIFKGLLLAAGLLAAFVLSGFNYELTGRIALAMALCLACWLPFRAVLKRRQMREARAEMVRRASEIRDLGVPLPLIEGLDLPIPPASPPSSPGD